MANDHWALLSTVDDFGDEILKAINTGKLEPIRLKYEYQVTLIMSLPCYGRVRMLQYDSSPKTSYTTGT